MPKIIAVPKASATEAKFVLPEPEVLFYAEPGEQNFNVGEGDIVVVAVFKGVDTDTQKRSKQTLYFSRTANPADVEVEVTNPENGEKVKSILAIDTQGRQPLQFRCALSAPFLEEKEQTNGEGSTETSGGDPEDEEV